MCTRKLRLIAQLQACSMLDAPPAQASNGAAAALRQGVSDEDGQAPPDPSQRTKDQGRRAANRTAAAPGLGWISLVRLKASRPQPVTSQSTPPSTRFCLSPCLRHPIITQSQGSLMRGSQILHVTQRNQRNQKRASPVLTHTQPLHPLSQPASRLAPLITARTHALTRTTPRSRARPSSTPPVPFSAELHVVKGGEAPARRTSSAIVHSPRHGRQQQQQTPGRAERVWNGCTQGGERGRHDAEASRRMRAPPKLPPGNGGLFIKWGPARRTASQPAHHGSG